MVMPRMQNWRGWTEVIDAARSALAAIGAPDVEKARLPI
jgi:hypothetical protein